MAVRGHDATLILHQLRQVLAADKLSIGFFLGAGCPCAVRIPNPDGDGDCALIDDVKGVTKKIVAVLEAADGEKAAFSKLAAIFTQDGLELPTIEAMLNRVRALREVAGNSNVRGLDYKELDKLDKAICKEISELVKRSLPNSATPYNSLAAFIRNHNLPSTEVFTTNYDLLMEQALEISEVPYFDGFVGSHKPFFEQRAIEEDKFPKRWSRLWKLHGSLNWRYSEEKKQVFRSESCEDGDELLIHPSNRKYDDSRRMPYLVMIDRLRSFVRQGGRPVALIIIGYSFGDEHLNEAIVDNLKANPSAACFAFQFGDLESYPDAVRLAQDNPNLTVIAADAGVVRRQQVSWLARKSTDLASLQYLFAAIPNVAPEGEGGEEDEEIPCRFVGGDFAQFGKFLDEVQAHASGALASW